MDGRCFEVLIEGEARSGDYATGRTRGHTVVLVPAEDAPADSLVEVIIEGSGKHAARGSVKRVLAAPRRN